MDAPPGNASTIKVLLVEDHLDSARAMARLLKTFGHEVVIAEGLAEGRQKAKESSFDLLISDLALPDGSGLDLVRQLRIDHPHLKAIALSGFTNSTDIDNCKEAGFAAHLPKPVDFAKLKKLIDEVVKG